MHECSNDACKGMDNDSLTLNRECVQNQSMCKIKKYFVIKPCLISRKYS